MRDAAINLRALLQQRDLIEQAAQLLGKNRSDFMPEAACDKAQAVVLDQVFFNLDEYMVRVRSQAPLGRVPFL
ncbi:MAG: type II toxin-antitoxin system TacA family antitoxin [Leptospirales bacterium]